MRISKQGFYAYVAVVGFSLPFAAVSQASGGAADPFGAASDINAYVNEVAAAPPQPGALEVAEGKALEECGFIALNPNHTALELANVDKDGLKFAEYRKQALKLRQQRCHDFALNTHYRLRDARPLFIKAVQKNNLDAIAHNLSYAYFVNKEPTQLIATKAAQAATTGSPYALYQIANVVNQLGPFKPTAGGEIGSVHAMYAWQLVACDRGLNCAANSPVVQDACLGGGICGPGDYRTNLQYSALKPDEYQAVVKAEANINSALNNGTVASLFNAK